MKSITFKKTGLAFILHKIAFTKDPADGYMYL